RRSAGLRPHAPSKVAFSYARPSMLSISPSTSPYQRLSPSIASARCRGQLHVQHALFGKNDAQFLVREVDRDLFEGTHRIHPEKKRRRLVEVQLLEGVRIRENDREVLQRHAADRKFADERVVPGDFFTGDGFDLDGVRA